MELYTTFPVPMIDEQHRIDYQSKMVAIGSCFADNFAQKMDFHKLRITSNPFGVLFQPIAIENLLRRAFKFEQFEENDLFSINDLWSCYEVHSSCSSPNKQQMLDGINQRVRDFRDAIGNATHIVITLGTAWVYRHLQRDILVANCHKVPQQEFRKELLSVVDIFDSLHRMRSYIRGINAYVRIIFTISPVRHLKDGFIENQRSKSLLFTALHEFLEDTKDELQFYFPAYEILMDELREYRFYAEDLVHPSSQAIEYIWEKFKVAYIRDTAYDMMREVAYIQSGLAHRPFNPDSQTHQLFVESLNERIKSLQDKVSFIKF